MFTTKIPKILTTFDWEKASKIIIVILGIAIPTSTALTHICLGALLIVFFARNRYKQDVAVIAQYPFALLALLLFALFLLGITYTSASWQEGFHTLAKYQELLLLPLLILFFQDKTTQHGGLLAFMGAMALTLALSYLMALTGWDIGKGTADNPFIFKNHITQGMMMCVALYFAAVQWRQTKRWHWLYAIFTGLAFYNLLFMTQGRTGYLIVFCLLPLFFYQCYRWRGLLIGGLLVACLSGITYYTSTVLKERVDKISENLEQYEQGQTHTSVGARLEFHQNSLRLMAKHPVFGTGTGSFEREYATLAQQRHIRPTTNPHNEYLMVGVQLGVIGMGLFIYWLYSLWRASNRLAIREQHMAQGLLVAMIVGCLVNSFLLDHTEGHLFVYLIAIFYANLPQVSLNKPLID